MIRALAVLAAGVALSAVSPSSASFQGTNGRIAFVRDSQILTVLPDGSGETKLTSKGWNRWPAWSGDGTRIAYQSCCSRGSWQIWTMSSSGAGKKNVSNARWNDTHPAFSRDGTKIAFVRSGQIWVMNADGTDQKRLTAPAGYTDDAPAVSPEGTKVAFHRCCFGYLGGGAFQVLTVAVSGGSETNLSGTWGATSDFQPDWSPDGSRIVFSRCDCATTADEIYVMNANGSGQTRLSPGTNANHPRYSPDGSMIVLHGCSGGTCGVLTMTAAGARVERVADGSEPDW